MKEIIEARNAKAKDNEKTVISAAEVTGMEKAAKDVSASGVRVEAEAAAKGATVRYYRHI